MAAERRDQVSLSDDDTGIHIRIWGPSDLHHAQTALFRAMRAAYDAAGLEPLKLEIEVLPSGDILGSVTGCYHDWRQDPDVGSHRVTICSVAVAAIRSLGYIPYGTDA